MAAVPVVIIVVVTVIVVVSKAVLDLVTHDFTLPSRDIVVTITVTNGATLLS